MSSYGGGRVSVLARCHGVWRPEPMSAGAGAAQEVWLGFRRQLIPRPGQEGLPGALGARRTLSPIVGALVVRTSLHPHTPPPSTADRLLQPATRSSTRSVRPMPGLRNAGRSPVWRTA
jgi:hypothetical protein